MEKILNCGNRIIDLTNAVVMGILNVTDDSFSDGGEFIDLKDAKKRANDIVNEGAKIIDIGGESTRPGALSVQTNKELDRVIPIIEFIAKNLDVVISVDTSNAVVMQEAIKNGAHIINDVRSLQKDNCLDVVSKYNVAVCIMHMKGEPSNMQTQANYQNIIQEVHDFLAEKINMCLQAGIKKNSIISDVGFGFAKNLVQNLELMHNLEFFNSLDVPNLVGISRKNMIGQILNKNVDQRLIGSTSLAAVAIMKGAKIIRAHDVKETLEAVNMANAVLNFENFKQQ